MEQQKVFPTACFGFDKKVVLDYIYEQDTAAKAREAELTQHVTELEEQSTELQESVEELSAQCELLKTQLRSEKEACVSIRSSYEKLRSDADQLVQVARNKDKELQIQLELNKQLQNRNGELEIRLTDMAQELREALHPTAPAAEETDSPEELLEEAKAQAGMILERARTEAAAILEQARQDAAEIRAEAAAKEADHSAEVARLRDELSHIRESVGKTLSQFEGAIQKLDGEKEEKPAPAKEAEDSRFFPRESAPQETGRTKIRIRR